MNTEFSAELTTRDEDVFTFAATEREENQRLDKALASRLEAYSRAAIQKWIEEGRVLVDGRPALRPSTRLSPGQHVLVQIPPPSEPLAISPEPIPLDVLYEDTHLLVINKPAGMVVHPAPGHTAGTLVNALLARYPEWAEMEWEDDEEEDEPDSPRARPGVVHRLDKDTSGVLIVAKNAEVRLALQAQFQARQVEKVYLALVYGVPSTPAGVIEAPIGRDRRQRKRMAVVRDGKPARTEFTVQERFTECALLEVRPQTGRTHQIRVHLAFIGHPVVGDSVYGRRRRGIPCPRQFLHAARIAFAHPVSGRPIECTAPLPDDLAAILESLRRASRRGQ